MIANVIKIPESVKAVLPGSLESCVTRTVVLDVFHFVIDTTDAVRVNKGGKEKHAHVMVRSKIASFLFVVVLYIYI